MDNGWHVSIVENTSGSGSAFCQVGTCTSNPKPFLPGQRRMMMAAWTYGANVCMNSCALDPHAPLLLW